MRRLRQLLAGLLVVVAIGPVVLLLGSAARAGGASWGAALGADWLPLLGRSIAIAGAVAALATGLGGLFGFLLARFQLPAQPLLRLLLSGPLFLSPYLLAVAWSDGLYGLGWSREALFGPVGVAGILTAIYTPLAAYIVGGSLVNINASLEEAGQVLAPYPVVVRRIVLPLVRPAVGSSLGLIFVLALSEFSVPSYLGVPTLVTEVFTQFAAFYRYDVALLQSVALMGVCLLLLWPERVFLTRTPVVAMGSRSFRTVPSSRRGRWLATAGLGAYVAGAVGVPLALLTRQALGRGLADLAEAFELLRPTLLPSLGLAAAGAALLTGSAYVLARTKLPGANGVLLGLFAVPSTVLGIAYLRFYNAPGLSGIYHSSLIILLVYWGRFLFIPVRLLAGALAQLSPTLEEAARLLGASRGQRFRRILAPLLADAFGTAFLLGFILCLSELSTVILVYPPGTQVLSVKVFTYMANARQSLVSALSMVVLLISGGALAGLLTLRHLLFPASWRQPRAST
ncbi:binding-protein-dependent transport systems inner membrane component [Hymenobacter roseosalivarius DSM 11622]|uniref:Binding-protein-dependent transport systems inner membrane component n=2 Tax=Hymenobacter roseosalivarius TaxID=89967 RepID=A0A1W1VGN5_9BACT|nr:binding-protein-dependent transport systems inner membrane component [Hymenobacter roseosalivarius DSM 11622]